jgi:anti-sigma B factor antagonist
VRLSVSSCIDRSLATVTAVGEIDLATVALLRQAISDHIVAGHVHLLLDLTDVTFIDSTGLGVLVGTGKKTARLGGSTRVVCDNPRILRLLRITGLSRALEVVPTRDAAHDVREQTSA